LSGDGFYRAENVHKSTSVELEACIGTVHISAKAPRTSVAIWIRIRIRDPDRQQDLRGVSQELPEPNRACLLGVYAFLIWNNLCDLVCQTLEPRFSTPTRT